MKKEQSLEDEVGNSTQRGSMPGSGPHKGSLLSSDGKQPEPHPSLILTSLCP